MPHTKKRRFDLAAFMKSRAEARDQVLQENRKLKSEYKKIERLQVKVSIIGMFTVQYILVLYVLSFYTYIHIILLVIDYYLYHIIYQVIIRDIYAVTYYPTAKCCNLSHLT